MKYLVAAASVLDSTNSKKGWLEIVLQDVTAPSKQIAEDLVTGQQARELRERYPDHLILQQVRVSKPQYNVT